MGRTAEQRNARKDGGSQYASSGYGPHALAAIAPLGDTINVVFWTATWNHAIDYAMLDNERIRWLLKTHSTTSEATVAKRLILLQFVHRGTRGRRAFSSLTPGSAGHV